MTQHVQVPTIPNLKELGIKPKDLLVYAAIAKFKNSKTNEAYPSIATIGKEIGMTAPTIIKSIKALTKANLISVEQREGDSSIYKFSDYSKFEIFSYEFLDKTNLSNMEKSYIISIQNKLVKDVSTHTGSTSYTDKELSNMLNMDRGTISNLDKSLQGKGMLELIHTKKSDSETGLAVNQKVFDLDEFANGVVFELMDHNSRIHSIEKSQELQDRKNKDLEQRIKRMETVLSAKDINVDEEYDNIKKSLIL